MKKIIILLFIIFNLTLISCSKEKTIIGDYNNVGCIAEEGYQYCPSTDKCQKMWEEYCEEFTSQFNGKKVGSFEECKKEGYPINKTATPKECYAQGIRFFEEGDTKPILSKKEAYEIAQNSDCIKDGNLKDTYTYNSDTQTWWIDMETLKKSNSIPACVVFEKTKEAHIDWRGN